MRRLIGLERLSACKIVSTGHNLDFIRLSNPSHMNIMNILLNLPSFNVTLFLTDMEVGARFVNDS